MRHFATLLAACVLSLGAAASESSGPGAGRTIIPTTTTVPAPKPVIVAPHPCGVTCFLPLAGGGPPIVVDRPIHPPTVQPEPVIVAPTCGSSCRTLAGGDPPTVVDLPIGRRG